MKLSFVIPVYNVEKYIEKTLSSLISQTESDFEVIIVNDGSTDSTYNIVKKIISENRLKNTKLINKANNGVSSARNIGLSESTGNYVIFLDGDDYVSENLVSIIYNCINEHEPDVVYWGYNVVKVDSETIMNYFERYDSNSTTMNGIDILEKYIINRTLHIWTGSIAYRRDLLIRNNLKYVEGCVNGEDQEFIIKALLSARRVFFISQVLSFYVQREGSISHIYNIKRFDALNALIRTYKFIRNKNDIRLKKIEYAIKNEKIIDNFFYNYNSCLIYLFTQRNLSSNGAIKFIEYDIKKNYPELNGIIRTLMQEYRGKSRKMFIQIKLYLSFPSVYCKLLKFNRKIKLLFNRNTSY
ncbi:glycosyltransferase family 2 protein [Bacillus massilinigeriensis]|uniref:glycosyltransferase family 2 protein n=1 Tax=Bacillus massilionigeriensis TaxID=1805475 RepID=UPI00096B1A47|nr:glycosyltransferase [Bacillus massilionigeriensis]